MEQRIRDEQRIIETLQKDLETQKKKMRTIEIELKTDREKLDAFLVERLCTKYNNNLYSFVENSLLVFRLQI